MTANAEKPGGRCRLAIACLGVISSAGCDGSPSGPDAPPAEPLVEEAYVQASNHDPSDRFGTSIAISADGSTMAIGAPGEDSTATGVGGDQTDNNAPDAGAVYVFVKDGTIWTQQAYVKSFSVDAGVGFGTSVALSADGSMLAVGAPGRIEPPYGRSGVFVFTRDGTTWRQEWSQESFQYGLAENENPFPVLLTGTRE